MSNTSSPDSDAVRWTTGQVLDWMTNFTDSKEEIRVKILNIVQENDLDGHALKQLRDDPDELHDLLPVLKERLTFRAMMKTLYGPITSTIRNTSTTRPAQNNLIGSVDPHSPTQSPSTNLESPPPPPSSRQLQIPQMTSPVVSKITPSKNENQPHAVLPAFSSFVSSPVLSSSSQPLQSSNSVMAPTMHHDIVDIGVVGGGQNDMYRGGVYPTGIMSDENSQRITTSAQTPIYCSGQTQPVISAAMKPTNESYDFQYTYPEMKTISTAESSSHSNHNQTYDLPYGRSRQSSESNEENTYRTNIGTWNITKGAKYSKAHEITQKYKKILQRVTRSTSSENQPEHIPFPAPLPTFSPILSHQIEIGNLLSFKTRFVYECAQFYMSIDPTPTHAAYRNISMTIVSKYPDLADPNNIREPWRPFNTSLSQAIRNIRRRLRSVPGTGFPPVEPRYQHLHGRRFTPSHAGVNRHKQSSNLGRSLNMHEPDVSVVSTNVDTSEPVLIEVASAELSDDAMGGNDDVDYTEKTDIVIKMEDVTSKEEDGIPEEWKNEAT